LAFETEDTVNLGYELTNSVSTLILEPSAPPYRDSEQLITKTPLKVPANGATTVENVTATF
jgi:hypothetical protein